MIGLKDAFAMRWGAVSVAMVAALSLLLAACGSDSEVDTTSAPSTVTATVSAGSVSETAAATATAEGELEPWSFEDEEPLAGEPAEVSAELSPGDGEELEFVPIDPYAYDPESFLLSGDFDPCSLITPADFANWVGDGEPPNPLVLEGGEACGYISLDDTRRLAIGVIERPDPDAPHFIPYEAGGEGVEAPIGRSDLLGIRWITNYPIPQSSSLSVEVWGFDLVIEISARDGSTQEELLDGAIAFAQIALDTLAPQLPPA